MTGACYVHEYKFACALCFLSTECLCIANFRAPLVSTEALAQLRAMHLSLGLRYLFGFESALARRLG